jgi:quercetin dioxygenase-like cupin family protein
MKTNLLLALAAPVVLFGAVALPAAAQVSPLLKEPMALDPNYSANMITVDVAPNPAQPATTKGLAGHKHPGSTYAYVVKGEVVSRLGDGAEKHYKAGEAWSETPGQAHYLVNASATEPARLVVVMIVPKSATQLSEPLR